MQQLSKQHEEMTFSSYAPLSCKYIVSYCTSASSTLEAIMARNFINVEVKSS